MSDAIVVEQASGMRAFSLRASDGKPVQCCSWLAETPKAIVQIGHGMGEHAQRYDAVGAVLRDQGFSVYANDHRGHGVTGAEQRGYFGGDGWNRVLADCYEINCHARQENPDVPLVLLGHSMGATLAQQYVTRYGDSIDALVLSGSPGFRKGPMETITRWVVQYQAWRNGPDHLDEQLQKRFGNANKKFDRPGATGFEWLSRDTDEVQKYVEDEACGFVIAPGSLLDYLAGARAAFSPECLAKVPKSLPMYVFSGADDPVHQDQRNILRMLAAYRRAGVRHIDYKLYPGGRHEMFNETNRDEVLQDLISWLGKTVATVAGTDAGDAAGSSTGRVVDRTLEEAQVAMANTLTADVRDV